MATMTRQEVEIFNKDQLDSIKNGGPGTYELKYAYHVESTNNTIIIDYTINVGDIDVNASINYNGSGRGRSDKEIAVCSQNILELEQELELLKNLDTAVSYAWNNMNLVDGDINSYATAINSINPTIF